MIAPTDAQWDSPYVVTLNRVPNVDMAFKKCALRISEAISSVKSINIEASFYQTHKSDWEVYSLRATTGTAVTVRTSSTVRNMAHGDDLQRTAFPCV